MLVLWLAGNTQERYELTMGIKQHMSICPMEEQMALKSVVLAGRVGAGKVC